jgi:hypothetical protein
MIVIFREMLSEMYIKGRQIFLIKKDHKNRNINGLAMGLLK